MYKILEDNSDNFEIDALEIDDSSVNDYAIIDLNGLSINMITAQESILLDLIDSIEDKTQQRNLIEKVIAAKSEKKQKPQLEAVVKPAYTMTKVLERLKQDKPLSWQDLRTKINSLKTELVQSRKRIQILELANEKLGDDDFELKLFDDSKFNIDKLSNVPKEYLNVIKQTIFRKYVLRFKIMINQEFILDTLVLVDTRADCNIIRKGLIPMNKLLKRYLLLLIIKDYIYI